MDEVGAMDMLVNKILGAKFMYGKPWILLGVIYFAAFIGGMFNAMVMTIVFIQLFISIFSIISSVFALVNVKKFSSVNQKNFPV